MKKTGLLFNNHRETVVDNNSLITENKPISIEGKRKEFRNSLIKTCSIFLALIILIVTGIKYLIFYPGKYPLDRLPELVSSFGELRPSHFHMGIDFGTGGRENLPVRAIKDGYVSRVVVEEYNMGKSIYVSHSDGTTTTYGHLNAYFNLLEKFVHEKQYRDKSWQQDDVLDPKLFTIKKGSIIGYSGNTGQSEAPHLHFEIRNTKSGTNLNPFENGIEVPAKGKFQLDGLYWYDRSSGIYAMQGHLIELQEHSVKNEPILVNSGSINFAVNASDVFGAKHRSKGVNHAFIFLDGKLVFSFAIDSISNNQTKYINACIDYPHWFRTSVFLQLLCQLPGNKLNIFQKGSGVIDLSDRKVHAIRMELWDALNNNLKIEFSILYMGKRINNDLKGIKLFPNQEREIFHPGISLNFSKSAFYDTVFLNIINKKNSDPVSASEKYFLGDGSIPIHDPYLINLKTTLKQNSPARSKTIIQLVNKKNKIVVKGKWNGDWIYGKLNELGEVNLIVDSEPPLIESYKWSADGIFTSENNMLIIKCKDDNLLKEFYAELDGQWILFSKKGDYFTYSFDEYCKPGKHTLVIRAIDLADNESIKTFHFTKI